MCATSCVTSQAWSSGETFPNCIAPGNSMPEV
jgi:hypothetical protein